jgi:hypothetical protein
LGLNKKSVNHASLSELGRHPLHYEIVKRPLKYCYRWENLTTEFPFFVLLTLNIPHNSEPYNKIGVMVWSKTLNLVLLYA